MSHPARALPRLQRPLDSTVEVEGPEWLCEPAWGGTRIVARLRGGEVETADEDGAALDEATATDVAGALMALAAAAGARSAVFDAVWTGDVLVMLDLLELDGEPLLDVPFQERRRLLGSVAAERPGLPVRLPTAVRAPFGSWRATWRAGGFSHYLARHQNARYLPGERSDDWLRIELRSSTAGPGLAAHLFGSRRPRARGDR